MSATAEIAIVRALLAAGDGFVSGTALARTLGVSRVAVWQHMEKLREQGFAFEAARARGYRLTARPATLNAVLLRAQLAPGVRDFPVEVLAEVDSTNDEASRRLAAGAQAPFAIIARRQTRGRGRFGRSWHSEANGNLYVSFAFRPLLPPGRMQTFTLWMGANVCELLANFCRATPSLKWPNDVLFAGRKAGGILTEARMDADQIRDLVLGLGLNLLPPTRGWPSELAGRATSLSEHMQAPMDPNRFAAALVGRINNAYERFVRGTYLKTFAELWNRHDLLRGREIVVVQGNERARGVAAGIDDEGSLILRTDAGPSRRFRAGEVTLEKS